MTLSNSEKQKAWKDRQAILRRDLEAMFEELTRALEAAESKSAARLVQGLPDEPGPRLREFTERLRNTKLIACRRVKS